jgi:hypothetical protein
MLKILAEDQRLSQRGVGLVVHQEDSYHPKSHGVREVHGAEVHEVQAAHGYVQREEESWHDE